MTDTRLAERMDRNVRLFPWYVTFYGAFFWFPVFFLYFAEHVRFSEVLLLEAVYYTAVVVCEVPSGYFSDRLGRKPTLILSALFLIIAYGAFFAGGGFGSFAFAQVCLALGFAFNSGTDAAFHYDSLEAAGRGEEYPDREERVARRLFVAGAVAAVAGGIAGSLELRLAYGLSFVAALVGLAIALAFTEPPPGDEPAAAPVAQMKKCVGKLSDPLLAWLFGFSVVMTVFIHVPYQFYQPYIDLLDLGLLSGVTTHEAPIVTGLHAAAAMMIGSFFAARGVSFTERLGLRRTFLIALGALIAMMAVTGLVLDAAVVILLLFRAVPKAIIRAPMNAAIAPRVSKTMRASYLSMQSLAGRLAFAVLLVGLSFLGETQSPEWAPMSRMLLVCAGIGAVAWVALAVVRAGDS